MTTITTRAGKGSPLTNAEVDGNFNNLNSDKVETSAISAFGGTLIDDADAAAARTTLGLGTAAVQNDDRYAHRANNLSDLASAATALVNLGLTATAAELNLLDGALDHATAAWEAGTATEAGVPSPADVKAAIDALAAANLAAVDEDIIPDADSSRDIGSTANRWAEGWFDEVTTTDLSDGTNSVPTTTVINGSAKAWANYDGTVPSVRDSLNLSSLTDNATGDFTANYSAAFANANYAAKGAAGRQSSTSTTAYWNFPTGSTLAYSVSATNFISGYSIGTSSGMGVLDCFITLFSVDGDLA